MKKFLTLVLALVLVFGLTVPAMAFTTDDSEAAEIPYELSIYLVEYDSDAFVGLAGLPSADRGYAKNEVVAAVVEMFVPKNKSVAGDGYLRLQFSGSNVNLFVTDNNFTADVATLRTSKTTTVPQTQFTINGDHNKLTQTIAVGADNYAPGSDTTYKWLFFGKVTDDDASLSAKLLDGAASVGFTTGALPNTLTITLDNTVYTITKDALGTGYTYTVTGGKVGLTWVGFQVSVDKNYKSTGMSVDFDMGPTSGAATAFGAGTGYFAYGVNTDGEFGIVNGAVVETSGAAYNSAMDVYEDIVVDVFGMDYFLIGNYVRNSYFENLASAKSVTATVDIEPWTAYVTVPDNIVVDPPKTGDAASIMGFVMVALSGAGAVALKKRG